MRTGEDVCGRGRERIEQNRVQRIENRQQRTENKEKRTENRETNVRTQPLPSVLGFCLRIIPVVSNLPPKTHAHTRTSFIQVHYGDAVEGDSLGWHSDGFNSVLHMAIRYEETHHVVCVCVCVCYAVV